MRVKNNFLSQFFFKNEDKFLSFIQTKVTNFEYNSRAKRNIGANKTPVEYRNSIQCLMGLSSIF